MRKRLKSLIIFAILVILGGFLPNPAVGEVGKASKPKCTVSKCVLKANSKVRKRVLRSRNSEEQKSTTVGVRSRATNKDSGDKSSAERAVEQSRRAARVREAAYRRQLVSYKGALAKQQQCMRVTKAPVVGGNAAPFCTPPVAPVFVKPPEKVRTPTDPAEDPAEPQITLTSEEVAYMAFAKLRLDPPTLGIGPSPDRNKWKMAAVGYPLWLWGDGNTDPAPVSDAVFNLYVSLDAHVASIDFDMGDGHTVTCRGTGTKWTTTVAPKQKSPTCGYTYQKPSLPKGKYTVTVRTHWAVDWNINGTTGTIPFIQATSTTIPVGELQVLVR